MCRFIALSRLLDQQLRVTGQETFTYYTQEEETACALWSLNAGWTKTLRVLLELQFTPLDNELGDWFQLLTQRDGAAGVILPVLMRTEVIVNLCNI